MSLGPGQTLNLKLKAENINGGYGFKVDATAKRKKQCPKGFDLVNGHCEGTLTNFAKRSGQKPKGLSVLSFYFSQLSSCFFLPQKE